VIKGGEPMCACHEGYAPDQTTGLSCLPLGTAAPQPAPAPAPAPTPAPTPAPAPAPAPASGDQACKDRCWAEYAECVHTRIPVCQVDDSGAVVPAPGQTGMTVMQCATLARPCDDEHGDCLSACSPAPSAPAAAPTPAPAKTAQTESTKLHPAEPPADEGRARTKRGLIIGGAVTFGLGYVLFAAITTGLAVHWEDEIANDLETKGWSHVHNPELAKLAAWIPFAGPWMVFASYPAIGGLAKAGCVIAFVLEAAGATLMIAGAALPAERESKTTYIMASRRLQITPLIGPGELGLAVSF
jgi:hypothetical protein